MSKFTKQDNLQHWDEFASVHKSKKSGASYDETLVELENKFIISRLKKIKAKSLLDIGCGNGQRTLLFSKFVQGNSIGIDYSENMIKQTKIIKKNALFFENADIMNYKTDQHFDVIVSCRCIINQNTVKNQIELFNKLHRLLSTNGHLIIAEASTEGLNHLNKLRQKYGLKRISEHWFNLHIKEAKIFPKIKHLYKIEKINRLGLYYFIARVIQPASIYPKEPMKGSILDKLASKSQNLFFDSDATFEKYGRHLLIDFKKI